MNINVSGNYTLELAPEAFILNTANIYLQCNTSSAPVVITLPRITSVGGVTTTWGFKIYVNDVNNNASVNNITLTPHPADKINGTLSTPVVLNTNGVTGHLQVTGTNSWEFTTAPSGGGTLGYKVYTALLTQSSTNVPVVTVIQNTIGNIVWTRGGAGDYRGALTGAFPLGKTWEMVAQNVFNKRFIVFQRTSDNLMNILTMADATAGSTWHYTQSDDVLLDTSIEIRVYP